jgi:hypothetical protein
MLVLLERISAPTLTPICGLALQKFSKKEDLLVIAERQTVKMVLKYLR